MISIEDIVEIDRLQSSLSCDRSSIDSYSTRVYGLSKEKKIELCEFGFPDIQFHLDRNLSGVPPYFTLELFNPENRFPSGGIPGEGILVDGLLGREKTFCDGKSWSTAIKFAMPYMVERANEILSRLAPEYSAMKG